MLTLKQMVERWYGNERRRWLLAALIALLVLLAALLSATVTYYDNDDLNIAWALAGYRSGSPSFSHPFINCIAAALVSGLYTVIPQLPWWLIVQLLSMLAGMTAVGTCLFKLSHARALPFPVPLLFEAALCAGLWFYPVVLVMFTVSSALAGTGAVALVLAADLPCGGDASTNRRAGRGYLVGSVVLLCVAFLIRQSSGVCLLCFYLGALAFRYACGLTARSKAARRRVLATLLVALACAGLLTGANAYGRSTAGEPGFPAFDEARSTYLDYPHDSYPSNPALYASVGWDDTLYTLTEAWFFMDARISADALQTLAAGSEAAHLTPAGRLSAAVRVLTEFLQKYPIARLLLGMLAAEAALLILLVFLRPKRLLPFAGGACMLLGAAALVGFLCYQGRINLRTFMTVCDPAIVSVGLLLLFFSERKEAKENGHSGSRLIDTGADLSISAENDAKENAPSGSRLIDTGADLSISAGNDAKANGHSGSRLIDTGADLSISAGSDAKANAPSGSRLIDTGADLSISAGSDAKANAPSGPAVKLAVAAAGLIMLLCAGQIFRTVLHYDETALLAESRAMVDYCLAHPDNVYIRDVYVCNNVDALTVYPHAKPTNLIDWGGCDMYTKARADQLLLNGLDSPYADVFLQDGVYYICQTDGPYLPMLAAYMASAQGAAGYDIVDEITDGVSVVRFLP